MERVVKKEWLDDLAANDPLAKQSRRDIQSLNLISGHHRIMAEALHFTLNGESPGRLIELGAGNGRFLLSVARRWQHRSPKLEIILVDRADGFDREVRETLKELGWNTTIEISDALTWLQKNVGAPCGQIMIANQFLHQFEFGALTEMLGLIANSSQIFISVEPRRNFFSFVCSHCVGLVGCGAVTRCDAPISVRAGFNGRELCALWPEKKNWQLTERRAGLFSHLFIAKRKN